jgi:dephospho-CoA kinase
MATCLRIGLTGGIGSGKSTVAELFAAHGVPVIDADHIARELVIPGSPALDEIVAAFGPGMLGPDGTLDRSALRRRVFAQATAKHRLEAILHPRIRAEMERRAADLEVPYCLLVIPLLVEAEFGDLVSRVLVVDVPEALQVARTVTRDGVTAARARAILRSQATRTERLGAADDVLVNTGNRAELARRVADLHDRYLRLARADLPAAR